MKTKNQNTPKRFKKTEESENQKETALNKLQQTIINQRYKIEKLNKKIALLERKLEKCINKK